MKRKDFLKGCLALGLVPLLPKLSKGKENLLSKVYGSGFRNREGGLTYGLMHPMGNEVEMVFLEYRKVKISENELKYSSPQGFEHKDKKIRCMEERLINRLMKKWRVELSEKGGDFDGTNALHKRVDKRFIEWIKWFSNYFNKK